MNISELYINYFTPAKLSGSEKKLVMASYATIVLPILIATAHVAVGTFRWVVSKINRNQENRTILRIEQMALQQLHFPRSVDADEWEKDQLRRIQWITVKSDKLSLHREEVKKGERMAIDRAIPWLMQCLICRGIGHGIKEIEGECIEYMGDHKQALFDAILDPLSLLKYAEMLYEKNPKKSDILAFFERSLETDAFKNDLKEAQEMCRNEGASSQEQERVLCRLLSIFDQVTHYPLADSVYHTPPEGPSDRIRDLEKSYRPIHKFSHTPWYRVSRGTADHCTALGSPFPRNLLHFEIEDDKAELWRRAEWINVKENSVLSSLKGKVNRRNEQAIQRALPWLIQGIMCRKAWEEGDGARIAYMGQAKEMCINAILDPRYLRQYAEKLYEHNPHKKKILDFVERSFNSANFQDVLLEARQVCGASHDNDLIERRLCAILDVFKQAGDSSNYNSKDTVYKYWVGWGELEEMAEEMQQRPERYATLNQPDHYSI